MANIYHDFTITASPEKVFEAISESRGLNNWWTKNAEAQPETNGIYKLNFGPEYNWEAVVTKYQAGMEFELKMTKADSDWLETQVGFLLSQKNSFVIVHFYHTGWPKDNEHFKISSYCWAMYLRILKRYVEFGEQVPYETRLNV